MSKGSKRDWNDAHKSGQNIQRIADDAWSRQMESSVNALIVREPGNWHKESFTAKQLQKMRFKPIREIVKGIITEGLNMLAGRPKFGKSWLALEVGIAVATGDTCLGSIQCKKGAVLYAACEDSKRRLQSRMTKLIGANKAEWPAMLTLTTKWRRLDKGGVEDLREWIDSNPDAALIILDTLASVKPIRANSGYQEDYTALEALHQLANDKGIAILILHHQRKSEADDPLDTISGTLGLAGCVDTPIIMAGTSQGKTLYVRGRDIEEAEHAVTFDKATCRWSIMGEAAEVHRSATRQKILKVLKAAKEDMLPSDIAVAAELKESVVRVRLGNMVRDGEVTKPGRGLYAHPSAVKTDK